MEERNRGTNGQTDGVRKGGIGIGGREGVME